MPPLCHMALGAVASSRALPSKPCFHPETAALSGSWTYFSLGPHGCATHVVPKTPFCRFRSCPELVSHPSARDRQGQKSLLGVGRCSGWQG